MATPENTKTTKHAMEASIEHVTPVGGNVFEDLGFPPDEAAALKAAADKEIALDKAIFASLLYRWRKVSMVIAKTAERLNIKTPCVARLAYPDRATAAIVDDLTPIGDRLAALVRQGRVEGQGDISRWHFSEVRLSAEAYTAEMKKRLEDYIQTAPDLGKLKSLEDAEEAARCPKCQRVIFCGARKLCGDPECPHVNAGGTR